MDREIVIEMRFITRCGVTRAVDPKPALHLYSFLQIISIFMHYFSPGTKKESRSLSLGYT